MILYLEVLDGRTLVKKPVCKIPDFLYEEFIEGAKASLNAYIAVWAKSDFAFSTNMGRVSDVDTLTQKIQKSFEDFYSELCAVENVRISKKFWVSYWVASHFQFEVEKRKLYDNRSRL